MHCMVSVFEIDNIQQKRTIQHSFNTLVNFIIKKFERIVIFSEETYKKLLTQKELYDTIKDKGGVHDV